jgi:glycosyltransferase involved in cell wall biosynthesis
VPSFAHLDVTPSHLLAGPFDDDWVNLLFVGRVIPNKRLDDVIRAFAAYKRSINPRSRLLLVGSYGGFELYFAMLQQLVAQLRVPDVHFLGHVSNEELSAVYDVADVFLCASEHEGFCVPLIEAFHKGVPVIAYAATAVPATMDGGGVLYTDKTPLRVAHLVDAVVRDAPLRARIVAAQDAALARLVSRDFDGTLLRLVDRVAAAPAPPRPHVAFDFWDQYARQDELEELRRYRPAAYEALPRQPAAEPANR